VLTKLKLHIALVALSATLAVALLSACSVEEMLHLEPSTPPVGAWPKVQLVVDPALRSPESPTCTGSSHRGAWVAPEHLNPEHFWKFEAVIGAHDRRFIHMQSGNGFGGERFEFAFMPTAPGEFQVGVLGRYSVDFGPPFEHRLQGLTGTVTVNTLNWREHEPIHVRFELRYYYDGDPANWSTIEVCSQATPTHEE
jgi:hypothetical protein